MKTFEMVRGGDESGVSGTGLVLRGVLFPNGTTVIQWDSSINIPSLGIYNSYEDFEKIHITSHPTNKTEIIWHEVSS